jgi:hypothetical protein
MISRVDFKTKRGLKMNLANIFSQIIAAAKLDEEKALLPLIAATAMNIATNPTGINIVAQGTQLLQGAIAAQPNIGQSLLKDLATVINTEAQALLPQAK